MTTSALTPRQRYEHAYHVMRVLFRDEVPSGLRFFSDEIVGAALQSWIDARRSEPLYSGSWRGRNGLPEDLPF